MIIFIRATSLYAFCHSPENKDQHLMQRKFFIFRLNQYTSYNAINLPAAFVTGILAIWFILSIILSCILYQRSRAITRIKEGFTGAAQILFTDFRFNFFLTRKVYTFYYVIAIAIFIFIVPVTISIGMTSTNQEYLFPPFLSFLGNNFIFTCTLLLFELTLLLVFRMSIELFLTLVKIAENTNSLKGQ